MNELTCKTFIDFLDDYRSGALPPDRRAAFEAHLAICRQCRDYLRTFDDAIALGRAALQEEDASIPPEVPARLVDAVLSAIRQPPSS